MQTLHRFGSLQKQRERLREYGLVSGQGAADVDFIWERWVSEREKERVGRLEMVDEVEEWRLLGRHYCIAWGWRDGGGDEEKGSGQAADGLFEHWKQTKGQDGD